MSESAILLKDALVAGVSQRYALELSQSQQNAACSPEHMQKMSDLLGYDVQAAAKARKRKLVIAALILAAALVVGSLTAYANRDAIREFFVQVFDEYISLEFPGEQPSAEITERYSVGYVPQGYTLTQKEVNYLVTRNLWSNAQGQVLRFSQLLLNVEIRFDPDYGESRIIEHGNMQIYCRVHEGAVSYIWNDGKYALVIYDATGLSLEEILKIIDSAHIESES